MYGYILVVSAQAFYTCLSSPVVQNLALLVISSRINSRTTLFF